MKILSKAVLFLTAVLFISGCATSQPLTLPAFSPVDIAKEDQVSKVDAFTVILDASSSMGYEHKLAMAKAVVERINATLPEMGQIAGLRTFGHAPEVSDMNTELLQGMAPYNTSAYQAGLDMVSEAGGYTPMNEAIEATIADFEAYKTAPKAVLIVTDAKELPADTITAAKNLKAAYGSSICFHPILIGGDMQGKAVLDQIAEIGGCGETVNAVDLLCPHGTEKYVKDVFLGMRDSDNDGVYDKDDQCPNTPQGAPVTAAGCWVLENLTFATDKAEIRPQYFSILDEAVAILKKNPDMNVVLAGHTDNVGSQAYNEPLSQRRADAVKAYMVEKGIDESRLRTKGYGLMKPVATNATAEGRAQNRRVEINPIY